MSHRFLDIATPGVQGLRPYEPGKPLEELEREYGISDAVKLASNENPLGPSPASIAAIEAVLGDLARYPDGNGFELKQALAAKHGLELNQITLGNGSNDVLELVARAVLTPEHECLFSEHAFAVYPIVTQAVGAVARVAKARDFGHDLEAMAGMINDKTRLIFIANPNNPTGTWLGQAELEAFLSRVPEQVLVVLDEAYVEYAGGSEFPDGTQWLARFPNLIVSRTFSKAYGLAGLRIGYGLSHPAVADLLNRVRQPFNVNSLSMVAACAALKDQDHIARSVAMNREGMAVYEQAFEEMGFDYIPSVGNFISVDVKQPAAEAYERLLREGVIVRPIANYGMPNYLRITVGTADENQRCLEAMRKVLL